ncbi:hypothetical protein DL93DRAFT_1893951 [Clavulina sp. PMI_390]|nr:hypothetical protein DL93DRAFT_1893951 [Clavulina sp. PMI_390]
MLCYCCIFVPKFVCSLWSCFPSFTRHGPIGPAMASPQFLELTRQLLHPPTHPQYVISLYTALLSIRRCLNLEAGANQQGYEGALSVEAMCQAWTLLAEIGMLIMGAGLGGESGPDWARGISADVERAISEGLKLSLSSKTSLRPFWVHLTSLHAHLALWQHNVKFSRAILKRLQGSLTKYDPPSIHYSVLLAWHANLLAPVPSYSSAPAASTSPLPSLSPSDIYSALQITHDLHIMARQHGPGHDIVVQLALVLRLRTLARAEMWHARRNENPGAGDSVATFLAYCEAALHLPFDAPSMPEVAQLPPITIQLQLHTLIIGVLYFTLTGNADQASRRLTRLYVVLDESPQDTEAYLKIGLPDQPPLIVQTTHPRVLYELAFLISSVSKRDLVGRKPRRKIFAEEGLKMANSPNENVICAFDLSALSNPWLTKAVIVPMWASLGDAREVEDRLAKMKADFLCENASIAIIRNEFERAKQHIDTLIAHTRTYSIFPLYASRITLLHAHLAHATARHSRALACYRAAAHLDANDTPQPPQPASSSTTPAGPQNTSRTGGFVRVAARAGEVGLLLGMRAQRRYGERATSDKGKVPEMDDGALDVMAQEVAEECKLFPGALASVGKLIEAVLSSEIVRAKQRLKASLDIASAALDNHLRALVITLTSAHYVHTASDHAKIMLDTARQLAAGMGAPLDKEAQQRSDQPPELGNAPLGLWVGERFEELYLRQGNAQRAHEQRRVNDALRQAVRILPSRGPP